MRLLALFVLLLAAAPALAAEEGEDPLADWREIIEIFDKLGMPSAKGRQFVLANAGNWWIYDNKDLRFEYVFGFVLEEREGSRLLLTQNLGRESISKEPRYPPEWESFEARHSKDLPLPGAVKEIDYEEFCRDFLDGGVRDYFGALGHFSSGGQEHPVECALYAYWAWQRGEAEHAGNLFRLAERSMDEYREHRSRESDSLLGFIRKSVATNVRWRAIVSANGGADLAELLDSWRTVEKLLLPEDAAEAREMIALYSRMLAEDATWVEPSPEELAARPPEMQAGYWLHHLRDVSARQMTQPGSVSVFGRGWEGGSTCAPARRLQDLGFAAVPLLIEHLDDPCPTRCMGFWRDFVPGSYHLLRYGDACREILTKIAGRPLPDRATALAWWKEVGAKGEERVLAEGAAAGTRDSVGHAERLIRKYPDTALGPLTAGLRASGDAWTRTALVRLVADVPGDGPVPVLLQEMRTGPFRAARVAAAEELRTRGDAAAVPAMIAEWRRRPVGTGQMAPGVEELIRFLVRCGSVEAIRALGEGEEERPIHLRYEILDGILDGLDDFHGVFEPTAEVRAAAEDLLVAATTDRRVHSGVWGSVGGVSFGEPRLCDFAGLGLHVFFPDRYESDISAPEAERDAKLAAIRAIWREARGLPPEPPPLPLVESVPAERMRPLIDAVAAAKDDAARAAAVRAIEAYGLGALPAVRAAGLDDVARRLATIVRERRVPRGSLPLPEKMAAYLDALEGEPLTMERYAWFLRSWREHATTDRQRLRVDAWRFGDDTGVILAVAVEQVGMEEGDLEPGRQWVSPSIGLGGRRVDGDPDATFGGPDAYTLSQVEGALAGAPELPFRIMVALRVRPE